MSALAAAGLDPARRLVFSPRWQGLSVVFDSRSGDFWIVSSAVRDILHAACADSERAAESLRKLPPAAVETLAAHGIIQTSTII